MIESSINKLVQYGLSKNFFDKQDCTYITNRIIEALHIDEYNEPIEAVQCIDLEQTLNELCDYAVSHGIIENTPTHRDLFDTHLMGLMLPLPSTVTKEFYNLYKKSPIEATDYYYQFSKDTDYIRRYRICKDVKWVTPTQYGDLDITINLSKPEKDPKAIAAAKAAPQSGYPKCLLCRENEGYAGRINSPARQNHRIIPVTINNSQWFMQYSPYVYYNEHCIVFNSQHTPMAINKATFKKILDFVKQFPHYFVGSNADLPIVGGSILSHDHFQGGNYNFAMAKAPIETSIVFSGFEDVEAGIVKWPMSVIRIRHTEPEKLVQLADRILAAWRIYTDADAFIYANTNGEPHNTITPIARMVNGKFELDLVLRNNITTKEHPMGVYHPHAELHHIKKENIGLIEVMGLAVLPSRLKEEMDELGKAIIEKRDIRSNNMLAKHADWADEVIARHADINAENVDKILKDEIGIVFSKVLEHAGVFKRDDEGKKAFVRFVKTVR